jgi:hypothetical protein
MDVIQKIKEYAQAVLNRDGAPLDLRVDEVPEPQQVVLYSEPASSEGSLYSERSSARASGDAVRRKKLPHPEEEEEDEEIKALKLQVKEAIKKKRVQALRDELKKLQEE